MAQPGSPSHAEAATAHFPGVAILIDDRRFAYRCMMQPHKMLKPSHLKLGIGARRQK